MHDDAVARFAGFVATLGRGPGKSRALTRAEAREALGMVLRGDADAHQVGAFLMLLRYRGEDAEEITGLVEAVRAASGLGGGGEAVDLDWPSYGAGRTREQPWFLLAALALARAGVRVLMHGGNEFSSGTSVATALASLGMRPASDRADIARRLARDRFAYWPIQTLSPATDRLLGMRALFGLRSPINTVARLLNPFDAAAGVDGVFHPAYLGVHMGVAERMARPCLLVLKGGGGEAELNPAKPAALHLWRHGVGRTEIAMPALSPGRPADAGGEPAPTVAAIWRGEARSDHATAIVTGTVALGLLATGRSETPEAALRDAALVWSQRG